MGRDGQSESVRLIAGEDVDRVTAADPDEGPDLVAHNRAVAPAAHKRLGPAVHIPSDKTLKKEQFEGRTHHKCLYNDFC